jgi:hypothetical protein
MAMKHTFEFFGEQRKIFKKNGEPEVFQMREVHPRLSMARKRAEQNDPS